ncbi:MAG: magnesium/cobalt transporter CorA [Burkholderiaceae bacterium]|jgi:magnesium transporter|nr:MAG: magnesium/cobalt transporter CorA [Burkholderiaceae bacterium]
MINVFALSNGRLYQEEVESPEELSRAHAIWVDLEEPTLEEKRWVKQHFGLVIPEDAIDEDIEESARFYSEDDGELHIRSDFLVADADNPHQIRVAFILNQARTETRQRDILFSIHDESVPALRLVRMRARRMPGLLENAKDVLLALLDGDTEYCADALENVYDALENSEKRVLDGDVTDEVASDVLATIARQEDMNGRIRRNMMDTRRAVSFLMRTKLLEAEQFEEARQILRDIDSLDGHTTFLSDKINFLMDATVGFLNVNQNKIIKIFSVASVALLPPTLIASVYGMNFRAMPELEWQYGYLLAILAMLASALLPMWYFRHRGWLK